MSEEKFVSINDVAEHFLVSISTVRGWIRNDTIPYLQVGKTYRFKLSEVESALREARGKKIEENLAAQAELIDNPDQDI
jgi:excisionase family DNA binding protein